MRGPINNPIFPCSAGRVITAVFFFVTITRFSDRPSDCRHSNL